MKITKTQLREIIREEIQLIEKQLSLGMKLEKPTDKEVLNRLKKIFKADKAHTRSGKFSLKQDVKKVFGKGASIWTQTGGNSPSLTKDRINGKLQTPGKHIMDVMWRQYEKEFPFLKIDSRKGFFRKGEPWIDIVFSWRKSVKWKA